MLSESIASQQNGLEIKAQLSYLNLEKIIKGSSKVKSAYELAEKVHEGQKRFSGEAYFNHLKEVSEIVINWLEPTEADDYIEDIVCASLLHDSVEDTELTLNEIEEKFGKRVSTFVEGVTMLRSDKSKEDKDRENLNFIAEKGNLTPEVFILKLADRLHNMRTLNSVPDEEKRRKKANETLRVYTKLAQSMGMWEVKKELEDLSFPYVYPEVYQDAKRVIDKDPRKSKAFIHGMEGFLKWILSSQCITCRVEARQNSYWTLYNKMEQAAVTGRGMSNDFKNINDLVSFKVITENSNPTDLYALLGQIHTFSQFKQFIDQERFDDFVAQPRDNGYSALQTTLNLLGYGAVEIAFATEEMEQFNNEGILSSIKKGESLDKYKRNILFDEWGEAWFLPLDATYVDFVYELGIGAQAQSIVVNEEEKPLSARTQNAVNVRVVRHDDLKRAPDPILLNHCSNKTKEIITREISLHSRDILVENGKQNLEQILAPRGLLDLSDCPQAVRAVIFPLGLLDLNELYFLVGGENIKLEEIDKKLDEAGITKENMGFTTIRVSGKNKPVY